MKRALLACGVVLALARAAHADGDVGVVVTGDTTMQPQVEALVEGWLRTHGHQLVASPLPPEATNKLIDCFVIEDTTCARKLIEAQAKSAAVVFARVDVADAEGGMRDVTLTAYWFERGADPIAEKRSCEKCTDATLQTTGDELMTALAGPAKEIAIAHREEPISDPIARPRRGKLPAVLLVAGGALLVTGIALYATSESDTGEKLHYRDTHALGASVGIGGVVVAGLGGYLFAVGGTF